jgi:NAD(P)-dependent dehydrogenase (short-subunit alcohol dehydrogenase family)
MSEQAIDALFGKTMQRFGRLDVLVNNAGVFGAAPIDEMSTETWDRLIATDLRAPFLCTRAAFRIMKKQGGGRIVNIGSISAQRVRPNNAAYSAAKFGLVGLTHTTALEGRKYGINCGVLHPGEVLHEGRPAEMQKEPYMTTDEIAAGAVFMACQPPNVNVLELIQLNPQQLYVGRG